MELYLIVLRTVLPPAGGRGDVGFLGRGVYASVAEVDHALACLLSIIFSTTRRVPGEAGMYVRLRSLKAQVRI